MKEQKRKGKKNEKKSKNKNKGAANNQSIQSCVSKVKADFISSQFQIQKMEITKQ